MGPRVSTSVICDQQTPGGTRGWVHTWLLVKTNMNSAAVWNIIRSGRFYFSVHLYTGLSCHIVRICALNHARWSDQRFFLFLSLRETITLLYSDNAVLFAELHSIWPRFCFSVSAQAGGVSALGNMEDILERECRMRREDARESESDEDDRTRRQEQEPSMDTLFLVKAKPNAAGRQLATVHSPSPVCAHENTRENPGWVTLGCPVGQTGAWHTRQGSGGVCTADESRDSRLAEVPHLRRQRIVLPNSQGIIASLHLLLASQQGDHNIIQQHSNHFDWLDLV